MKILGQESFQLKVPAGQRGKELCDGVSKNPFSVQ